MGFVTSYGGQEVSVAVGDIFDAGHEIVRNTPNDWWTPIASRFAAAPEEATTTRKRTVKAAEPVAPDASADA